MPGDSAPEMMSAGETIFLPTPAVSISQGRNPECGCPVEGPNQPDGSCEGCAHFEWEQDMGASYPRCKLKGEYEPERCDAFAASKLYGIYLGKATGDATGEATMQRRCGVEQAVRMSQMNGVEIPIGHGV